MKYFSVLVLVCVLVCGYGTAIAGQGGADAVQASISSRMQGSSELGDDQGGVSTLSAGGELKYKWAAVSYESTWYDWDDEDELPLGNGSDAPWDRLNRVALTLSENWRLDDSWGIFALGGVSAFYEEEMDDSFAGKVGAGLSWVASEDWMIRFGAMGRLHATGNRLYPMLGASWNYAVQEGFFANIGMPKTSIGYRVDPELEYELSVSVIGDAARLANDSVVEESGYVEVWGFAARFGVSWRVIDDLRLDAGPEYRFARRMILYNDDGESRNNYDVGDSLGFGAGVTYDF